MISKKKNIHRSIGDPPANTTTITPANHRQIFSNIRLHQWHTNEEIFNILQYFSNSGSDLITSHVLHRPRNGSVFIYDRKTIKHFKKDAFLWKRRKTGGAKSVREDRMCLKVNGVDLIYGSYSHSSLIATFHRRCYWLLEKPNIVMVHYLQMPNSDRGECLINLNASMSDFQLQEADLRAELSAMLWPYFLDQEFAIENLKLNSLLGQDESQSDFIEVISTYLIRQITAIQKAKKLQTTPLRINLIRFLNKTTNLVLSELNLGDLLLSVCVNKNQLEEGNNSNNEKNSLKILNKMINRFAENPAEVVVADNDNMCVNKCMLTTKHEGYYNNNVQLSISSSSSCGGEKLLLISNWQDFDTNSDKAKIGQLDLPVTTYQMLINERFVSLKQLNKHVLECILPSFDLPTPHKASTILIYIYENQRLFCPPIPFQITATKNLSKLVFYQSQFFLLERCMFLFRHNNWDRAYLDNTSTTDNSDSNYHQSNLSKPIISFGDRISRLLDSFITHMNSLGNSSDTIPSLLGLPEKDDKYEYSGQTILHLCASLGLVKVVEKLSTIKKMIICLDKQALPGGQIIEDELNLFNLDNNGETAMTIACRTGSYQVALALFKWVRQEPILPLDWTKSLQDSINSATVSCHVDLAQHLTHILIEIHNEKSIIFTNSLHLIDSLDDLNSLLTGEIVTSSCNLPQHNEGQPTGHEHHTNQIDIDSINLTSELIQQPDHTDYRSLFSTFSDPLGIIDGSASAYIDPRTSQMTSDETNPVHLHDSQTNDYTDHVASTSSSVLTPKSPLVNLVNGIIQSNSKSNNSRTSSISGPTPPLLQSAALNVSNDDQDKKIKTLADNIIAAMPRKIKTNSYSSLNSSQQASFNLGDQVSCEPTQGQQQQTTLIKNSSFNRCRPVLNVLRRNAASFDDSSFNNGDLSMANTPTCNSSGYYSSSARSSLSPVSALSFQFNQQQSKHAGSDFTEFHSDSNMFEQQPGSANEALYDPSILSEAFSKTIDDCPASICTDDTTCSTSFRIDSPPSTAEFSQYFHAASSSSYYKSSIENGFAQLTLTDDEQRELYEAALVIQNAYRRYIQRKKKKIRLDCTDDLQMTSQNTNSVPGTNYSYTSAKFNDNSLSRSSSTSLSSLTSSNSLRSGSLILENPSLLMRHSSINSGLSILQKNGPGYVNNSSVQASGESCQDVNCFTDEEEDEHNCSSGCEDDKQFQAACVIQKYYRRYKQYENLHKYTEAAVKIQTRYRIYKSSMLPNQLSNSYKLAHYQHPNSIDETSENSTDSLQYSNLINQRQISRKLVNVRQSARFSPSSSCSPAPPASVSQLSPLTPATSSHSNQNNLNATSDTQQQVHHHHHHHFHHHFHKNNKFESTSMQQMQQTSPQNLEEALFSSSIMATENSLPMSADNKSSIITSETIQNFDINMDVEEGCINRAEAECFFDASQLIDTKNMDQNISPNFDRELTERASERYYMSASDYERQASI